jgi:hypothetical protein
MKVRNERGTELTAKYAVPPVISAAATPGIHPSSNPKLDSVAVAANTHAVAKAPGATNAAATVDL